MPDYSQGKIYKIVSASSLPYIGFTTKSLSECFEFYVPHYSEALQVLRYPDSRIELIENYPCTSREELTRRKGEWQRQINCCNTIIGGRTRKEHYQDNREYYLEKARERTKESLLSRTRDRQNYYNTHKLLFQGECLGSPIEKVTCGCGTIVQRRSLNSHYKSEKHSKYTATLETNSGLPETISIIPPPPHFQNFTFPVITNPQTTAYG